MNNKRLLRAAGIFLLGAFVLFFAIANANADWPKYGEKYPVFAAGVNGMTAEFGQAQGVDGAPWVAMGFVTLRWPMEDDRDAVGGPYREGGFERLTVPYYIFDDIFPDDYTIGFDVAGEWVELDFSEDQAEAVRIDTAFPVKLKLPNREEETEEEQDE